MRRSASVAICLAVAAAVAVVFAAASPGARGRELSRDALIAQMVSEVSTDRLSDTIDQLRNTSTRFSPTIGCRVVGDSIFKYLSRLSLRVEYDAFRYESPRAGPLASGRNVIATLRGVESPDRVIVLGAHYDSYSSDPWRFAPGADDNGSGIAAILEIARVLSSRRFSLTIKVIAFDAEELGSFGAEHVAALAKQRKEPIVAVLNLDMVGYDAGGKRGLAAVPNRESEWLADRLIEAARKYQVPVSIVKRVNAKWARGDQERFWSAGYAAIDEIEDMPDSNPYYHTRYDTHDRLNMQFLNNVTRATAAAIAELAGPMPETRER